MRILAGKNKVTSSEIKTGLYLLQSGQPVEKPAPAIKPEQVFCLETKAETEKASKQQLHFSPILFVFRHPAPDGGHSISKWPAFSDSWQQI